MYNNNRHILNYGRMPNYYPTPTASYSSNHRYFSQYIRTDIGICFGLENVNLYSDQHTHSTENFSLYPKLPNLVNFYETKNDGNQCNHILFNHSEFSNKFYQNYLNTRCNPFSDRNNSVEYYSQDEQNSNYSFDTIYEQHLANLRATNNNSRWNNYNEAVSPKKKWMRHYMMSKNAL